MDDPDGVVTQGCFNMHPLDRAEDDGVASPIDPNFPGRYYLDPSCRAAETDQTLLPGAVAGDVATARYQLPPGVTCSRCILQMVYCEYIEMKMVRMHHLSPNLQAGIVERHAETIRLP